MGGGNKYEENCNYFCVISAENRKSGIKDVVAVSEQDPNKIVTNVIDPRLLQSNLGTDLIQVDLDDLVVLAAFIWHQQIGVLISQSGNL